MVSICGFSSEWYGILSLHLGAKLNFGAFCGTEMYNLQIFKLVDAVWIFCLWLVFFSIEVSGQKGISGGALLTLQMFVNEFVCCLAVALFGEKNGRFQEGSRD